MCVCRATEDWLSEMMSPGVRIMAKRSNQDGRNLVEIDHRSTKWRSKGERNTAYLAYLR